MKRVGNMLNEKEIELIKYMDYQVMNNGMDGWIGNRGYEKIIGYRKKKLNRSLLGTHTVLDTLCN